MYIQPSETHNIVHGKPHCLFGCGCVIRKLESLSPHTCTHYAIHSTGRGRQAGRHNRAIIGRVAVAPWEARHATTPAKEDEREKCCQRYVVCRLELLSIDDPTFYLHAGLASLHTLVVGP
ncbi:hypothetical protein BST61_g3247 [Cercospora zeina]